MGAGLEKTPINRLQNIGARMSQNAGANAQRRMNTAKKVAAGRFATSGLAGGEYKGETQRQIYKKDKSEQKQKLRDAKYQHSRDDALAKIGAKSMQAENTYKKNNENWKAEDAYKAAGFTNDEFINSLVDIDNKKEKLLAARTAWRQAQYDLENENGSAESVAKAEEAFEKAQKALSGAEDNHKNYVSVKYKKDAELEQARKIAKSRL